MTKAERAEHRASAKDRHKCSRFKSAWIDVRHIIETGERIDGVEFHRLKETMYAIADYLQARGIVDPYNVDKLEELVNTVDPYSDYNG